jgi:hypothetical protein
MSHYPAEVVALLTPERLAPLGPGTPQEEMRPKLAALSPSLLVPNARDERMAKACLAGLWLYHDFLDESHAISQDLPDSAGAFWHAIMHRREPDAWNSKYWWRKVGSHPVLKQLGEQAPTLGYRYSTPDSFVDYCERVRGKESEEEELAKKVQLLEWKLLFEWCFQKTAA